MLRRLFAVALLLPSLLGAQGAEHAAVVDLLDRMRDDINDLRYAEAIATGRAIEVRVAGLPVALRTRLRLLLAAAYFPEEPELQRPDSAVARLVAAVRDTPDASYPAELRWRGLDSLLAWSRATTVAAVLRVPARQPVAGPGHEARLPFAATPGTTVELRVVRRASEAIVHADTIVAEQGEFTLAAHDGTRLLLPTGAYELVLIARRGEGELEVARTYAAVMEAPVLALDAVPELAGDALLPESAVPDRRRIVRMGTIAGAATVALSLLARGDPDLRAAHGPDPRALVIGGAIVAGTAWFARSDEVTPLPMNVAANATTRAVHARAVAATEARNAAKLASHAGTLVMVTDVP